MKRTPLKRKRSTPRRKPAVTCERLRCKRRPSVRVSDDERYCRTHARALADSLQRLAIFERDRYTCQSCIVVGTAETLQRAHVISRGAKFIEYHEDNLVTLCSKCHLKFTLKPAQWSVWLATYRPGLHDRLALLEAAGERSGGSVDLASIIRQYEVPE